MLGRVRDPLAEYRGSRPPTLNVEVDDEQAMEAAFYAAMEGLGNVSPNPLVGCAIVDARGKLAAAAGHRVLGCGHAEVNAVQALVERGEQERLRGAHVYVTLEPCSHQGRTGACARMLAALPVRRVSFASVDPNPRVNGQGVQILEGAGIECRGLPQFDARARKLAEVYFFDRQRQRIMVGLKAETTLNGVIGAYSDGGARWITAPRAHEHSHLLRLWYDAVAVGRGMLERENPSLTPQLSGMSSRTPVRVVIDSRATLARPELLSNLNVVRHHPERTLWAIGADVPPRERESAAAALKDVGVESVSVERSPQGTLSATDLLRVLYERNVRSLLLEGGAGLHRAFLRQRQVDRIYLFQSSQIRADSRASSWPDEVNGLDLTIAEPDIVPFAPDWLIHGSVQFNDAPAASTSPVEAFR